MIGVCKNSLFCKNALINGLLLLHGSYIDDFLVIGVITYLVIMFGLSRVRMRRLKREKLRRRAERQAQAIEATSVSTALKDTESDIFTQ